MALNKRILFLTIFLFVEISVAATHVAVLETVSEKDVIGRSEKMFLTDKLRDRAKAVLPAYMGYVIMTRENINAMLPPGKSIEECEGSCLVETGKNIAADYVAQARVGKFGKQLTLTVELYETAANNLVASFTTRKDDAVGLLEDIEQESDKFFKTILADVSSGGKIDQTDNNMLKNIESKKNAEYIDEKNMVDTRDGQKYKTVKIGNQIWMARNLNYKISASSCYNGKDDNCEQNGRLYIWQSALKACPTGWHLPNKDEFEQLIKNVGGNYIAGKNLKSKKGWKRGGNGFNTYDFEAVPAGYKDATNVASYEGYFGLFWSSTEYNKTKAFYMKLRSGYDGARMNDNAKNYAFSVRCIKDSE